MEYTPSKPGRLLFSKPTKKDTYDPNFTRPPEPSRAACIGSTKRHMAIGSRRTSAEGASKSGMASFTALSNSCTAPRRPTRSTEAPTLLAGPATAQRLRAKPPARLFLVCFCMGCGLRSESNIKRAQLKANKFPTPDPSPICWLVFNIPASRPLCALGSICLHALDHYGLLLLQDLRGETGGCPCDKATIRVNKPKSTRARRGVSVPIRGETTHTDTKTHNKTTQHSATQQNRVTISNSLL